MMILGVSRRKQVLLDEGPLPITPCLYYRGISAHFDWGKQNEGSRQLAFALLLHFCGAEDAYTYYRDFYKEVIKKYPDIELMLWSEDIKTYINFKKGLASKHKIVRTYWKVAAKYLFGVKFYEILNPSPWKIEREQWNKEQAVKTKAARREAILKLKAEKLRLRITIPLVT